MTTIDDKIKLLLQWIEKPTHCGDSAIFNRLQAWSILSLLNKVNQDLETLIEQLDTSLSLDAARINFAIPPMRYLYRKIVWWNYGFEGSEDKLSPQIDQMACCLQNEEDDYHVTSDGFESFKTAMNQLCSKDKISSLTIKNALFQGYSKMVELLGEIRKKTENPEPHLYKKFWDDVFREYYSWSYDDCKENFNDWKKKSIGELSLEELKAKQKKEILKLLETKFCKFCQNPSGGEVKKRKLKIDEDDLEVGTELPEGFDVECTRFEKFIEWKGDCILSLNYEKLGQYIYQYYHKFKGQELYNITYFDIMMDFIHEEMAKIKSDLKQYLKRYQESRSVIATTGNKLDNKCYFSPNKYNSLSDSRKAIVDELLALAEKGNWVDGVTADNIKGMFTVVLGIKETPLSNEESEMSEKLWGMFEHGRGDRLKIVCANLVGYFAEKKLFVDNNTSALSVLFFGNKNSIDNINKGKNGRLSEVTSLLDTHVPKLAKQR